MDHMLRGDRPVRGPDCKSSALPLYRLRGATLDDDCTGLARQSCEQQDVAQRLNVKGGGIVDRLEAAARIAAL